MLAEMLRERNLLAAVSISVLALVIGGLAFVWSKRRPDWREIGVVLAVAFAYWMVGVRIESWEERTHLVEYGIIAALIHQALLERVRNGSSLSAPAAITVATTAVLGLLDESIQALIPNRFFDVRDIFFNAFTGFMVVAGRLAIAPQQAVGWRVWFLMLMAASLGWGEGVYWGWFDDTDPKTLQYTPVKLTVGYVGLAAGGMLIGSLQWLVLRKHLVRSSRWVLASLAALVVVGAIMFGVGQLDATIGWLIGISAFGFVAGVFQWLVLRGQVQRAGWWIFASTLGWVVGMPLGDMAGPPAMGAAYGAITGMVMVMLLRQPVSTAEH